MKLDEPIHNILLDIRQEIAEEEGIDLSIEELFEICNSQFVGGRIAVTKRLSFSFDYIGTFVMKNKDAYLKSVQSVHALKGTIPEEEYQKIVMDKRIANKGATNGSNLDLITDIAGLPSDVATPNYLKAISEMVKQVIEDES